MSLVLYGVRNGPQPTLAGISAQRVIVYGPRNEAVTSPAQAHFSSECFQFMARVPADFTDLDAFGSKKERERERAH